MKILFDFDDVLNDLSKVWVQELNRRHSTTTDWNDVKAYSLSVSFPELDEDALYKPYLDGTLYLDAHPVKEAQKLVERLGKEHELYVCTSNLLGIEQDTLMSYLYENGACSTVDYLLNFLDAYYPTIPTDHVIITADKSMIKADALIDDNPAHLVHFRGIRILLDKPYNQDIDDLRHNIHRVHTYQEIDRILQEEAV